MVLETVTNTVNGSGNLITARNTDILHTHKGNGIPNFTIDDYLITARNTDILHTHKDSYPFQISQ